MDTGDTSLTKLPERSALISDAYQEQQRIMHEAGPYGTASISYAPIVSEVINRMEVLHLLDYGCGAACNLSKHLKVNHKLTYQAYDPGVERFSKPPAPAEMVACIDVLEHIEPDKLDTVLDHLQSLTEVILFASICTAPARKHLPDGRNAHLIVEPLSWWLPKLWDRFQLQTMQFINPVSFCVVALAKGQLESIDGEML